MIWLYDNWYKSTIFLAVYIFLLAVTYILNDSFALFLIWMQTVVYLLHQFEEYIFPGKFIAFFNKTVLGSSKADFPLGKKVSFWINIPIIYVGFPISAILAGSVHLSIGLWTAYFSIINASSHLGMYFKSGYNPGLIVSVLLNIPVGLLAIYYLTTNGLVTMSANLVGLAIGFLIQLVVTIYGFKFLKPMVQ